MPDRRPGPRSRPNALWLLGPLVILALFVTVRQDIRAQQLEKHVVAEQARVELLRSRLEGLRHDLARQTDFARVEPRATARGLRAAETGQVLAIATPPAVHETGGATDLTAWLIEFLGPAPAQAEGRPAPSRTDP